MFVRYVVTKWILLTVMIVLMFIGFFFKQKTAYEMRISDWSSDVCSSDLPNPPVMIWNRSVIFTDAHIRRATACRSWMPYGGRTRIRPHQTIPFDESTARSLLTRRNRNFSPFYKIGRASGRERECQ